MQQEVQNEALIELVDQTIQTINLPTLSPSELNLLKGKIKSSGYLYHGFNAISVSCPACQNGPLYVRLVFPIDLQQRTCFEMRKSFGEIQNKIG